MRDRQWCVEDLSVIDDFIDGVLERADETVKNGGHPYGAHHAAMLLEYALIEQYVKNHKHPRPAPSDAGQRLEIG